MGSSNPSINGISTHPGPEQSRVSDYQRLNPGHTPLQISSQPKIRDVRISPDGKLLLYQVTQFYRPTERTFSELWLAEIDKPHSSIQLTNGEFNDRSGVFHPDGKRILFLSDRQVPGKSTFIYSLSIDRQISPSSSEYPRGFSKKPVQGFEISPDGKWIAFASGDETSLEDLQKVQEKNDAKVIGSKDGFSRLRVYNFETDEIRTLNNVPNDRQLEGFSWSSDSREILYRLRENRGTEWTEFEVLLQSISITEDSQPKSLGSYPRSPSGSTLWLSSGHIVSLQSYESQNILDARALHVHCYNHDDTPSVSQQLTSERVYGVNEDAVRMLRADTPHTGDNTKDGQSFLAMEVSQDTDSRIDIIAFTPHAPCHIHKFTLFHTSSDAIWFNSWDAKRIVNTSNPNEITYAFAGVLSSGPRHEPPNVWSGSFKIHLTDGEEEKLVGSNTVLSRSNGNLTQLSNHLEWLAEAPKLKTEIIRWKTNDGIELSGLVRFPPGYDPSSPSHRLPTILFIHGGPYRRDIPDYMPYFCNWRELCASAGYLTISPNYRGSQGRGHSFALTANAGIGVYDWPDCESMVDEVIARGWADSEKLGVAGWSHGGSLTAWGVTQTKTRYKVAVVGAGATHWETMVTESASPELEAAIGGSPPWTYPQNPTATSTTAFSSERKTSPIHNITGITTAILILHGERDERVPLGQSYGFYRGLKRYAAPRGREGAQLVVYPREPHGFVERRHAQDVMERVLVHFNTYI
ncbi:hypothetical protein AGABI1DRAFT_62015 [Agaricus bisporus var. burnettii JB137-S8]|uniref:Dipeptidyl-peptidase V n=1 Tax=Agaricus bisporus var. burnettii (strain JB137-S8 / ATCC MYA-4627 / FGSC 10392) TaxID=597362 RepID=K5WPV6_AGABU|nr:uncharacterized protein AGABI1DRAFT_62015 [Agaricus bisporus var. burnettii JB137-S8]EKM77386.1 hypothetical protein AGABI1DRAFT_62015 [Agaricus bisporus var. burnettii JB137-S8]